MMVICGIIDKDRRFVATEMTNDLLLNLQIPRVENIKMGVCVIVYANNTGTYSYSCTTSDPYGC